MASYPVIIIETISILIFLVLFVVPLSLHQCHQGHRCVYYRGGSLMSSINDPGYRMNLPFITSHYNIQTTWQTDKLLDVECGSSQGGQAYLDIEVVNKLSSNDQCILSVVGEHTTDYDKPLIFAEIKSEVAQFCKEYTLDDIVIREFDKLDEVLLDKLKHNIKTYNLENCLEIKKVRINRPRLDEPMRKQFESIEIEQKEKALAIQKKETEKVRLETQLQKEIMEKERERKTTEIEMEIQLAKARSIADKQAIIDRMNLSSKTTEATGQLIYVEKKAEGYRKLFSNPDYIKLEAMKSAYHNSKIIIGEIPTNSLFSFDHQQHGTTYPMAFKAFNVSNS